MDRDTLKNLREYLDKTDFPEEVKFQILLGAIMGVKPETIIRTATETLSAIETRKAEKETPRQKIQGKYTETELTIIAMLTENTGAHILDSGGAYGRNWQKNRKIKNWNKTPRVNVTIWNDGEVEVSINIYHYLKEYLEYNEKAKMLTKWLYRYSEKPELENKPWLHCMHVFADMLKDLFGYTRGPGFNSYNWENVLSQVIQGIIIEPPRQFSFEQETYVILQIHGGCDVRGGYTAPKIFEITSDEPSNLLFDMDRGVIASCKCTTLYLEEPYHWVDAGTEETFDLYETKPDNWAPVPIKGNAKNWEYMLRCNLCNTEVEFDW